MYYGSLGLWRGTLVAYGLNLAIRQSPHGSHCVLKRWETSRENPVAVQQPCPQSAGELGVAVSYTWDLLSPVHPAPSTSCRLLHMWIVPVWPSGNCLFSPYFIPHPSQAWRTIVLLQSVKNVFISFPPLSWWTAENGVAMHSKVPGSKKKWRVHSKSIVPTAPNLWKNPSVKTFSSRAFSQCLRRIPYG